ncbi:prion-like-(Q/N-rich) domain-bearing protein 25 [Arctopsyche grandis]|uniref:prion-like-(Q/N-rich) domain-bearing protein 25 n=1 Tax=Arctopsyche grandis TaxID=121162 RepID=UPI00406D8964
MKTDIWKQSTKLFFLTILLINVVNVDSQSDLNQKRATSNTCTADATCPDNAFCKYTDGNGYCNCKENYIIQPFNDTHRECLREADRLGDPCRFDIQCHSKLSVNSECASGACQCKSNSHFDDGRCYQTSKIGEKCVVTQNCYLGPDDISSNQAFCVRGICQCNLLHSPRDAGNRCLKDAMLGDQCEDNEHCTGDYTQCRDVCRCIDEYIVHPDEERCIKAATNIGDSCEIESQCTAKLNGTVCQNEKCVCRWDNHLIGSACFQTRNIGQRCTDDRECLMEDKTIGQCLQGSCTCQGCKDQGGTGSVLQPKITLFITLMVLFGSLIIL